MRSLVPNLNWGPENPKEALTIHSLLCDGNSYRALLCHIPNARGFVQSCQHILREKKWKGENATDKLFAYTFVCVIKILWSSGTILRIGNVLGTRSAISVSNGLIYLFYFRKVACLYQCSNAFSRMSVENLTWRKSGEGMKTLYSWTRYLWFCQSLITRDKFVL